MTVPSPSRSAWHKLRAAARVSLYSGLSTVLRAERRRPTVAERRLSRQLWQEAYQMQRQMFARPAVAEAVLALERADWRDFWSFATSVPIDLLRIQRKRRHKPGMQRVEVRANEADGFAYPDYYLHDFHNQNNGGLSPRAAATYEWQIRLLFGGTNRLMRQAVIDAIPVGDTLSILDIGCGTAAWVPQARLLGRQHAVTGVDLSPYYLTHASQRGDRNLTLLQANAEDLPKDLLGRQDIVVCIWLYHELPPAARERVTANLVAALKPGGILIYLEAAQQQDVADRDLSTVNTGFAADFDEPYFLSYQKMDLDKHFADHGLRLQRRERTFLSTLRILEKV